MRLLGGFEIRDDTGSVLELPSRKSEALVAYLALRPGIMHPRTRLAGLLWSNRREDQARASLRQCLSALNKQLNGSEASILDVTRQSVTINVDPSSVDVLEFERRARDGRADEILRSIDLYTGEFLEGVELRDPVGDEWLSGERERLRSLFAATLSWILDAACGVYSADTIIDCATRLLRLDPLQEGAYRALMVAHDKRGERGLALRAYRDCCEALNAELNVSPDEETLRVYQRIVANDRPTSPSTVNEADSFPKTAGRYGVSRPSVLVRPFEVVETDADQQYLADGMTEDIVTALTRFRELFVFGTRTSFVAKGRSMSVKQLGDELGVRYVVAGTIRRIEERFRVTVQLFDAESERQYWAESYDRALNDLFALQNEIVKLIVGSLVKRIEESGWELAARKDAGDMAAYDHVLRGRASLSHWTKEGIMSARDHFDRALELEPESSPAFSGLARSYLLEFWSDWSRELQTALERALEYANRAVLLDSSDHGAHQTLSMCYLHKRQYDMAFVHIEKGTLLNPNDYHNFCHKSFLLALSGHPEEGVKCSVQGLRENPLARGPCLMNAGLAHYTARYYEDAVRELSECMSFQLWRLAGLAASYAQLGEVELARETADELIRYTKRDLEVDFGSDRDGWLGYWQKVFPFKHPEAFEHLLEGFRKAGVPT